MPLPERRRRRCYALTDKAIELIRVMLSNGWAVKYKVMESLESQYWQFSKAIDGKPRFVRDFDIQAAAKMACKLERSLEKDDGQLRNPPALAPARCSKDHRPDA